MQPAPAGPAPRCPRAAAGEPVAARERRGGVAGARGFTFWIRAELVLELLDLPARQRKGIRQGRALRYRAVEEQLAEEGHVGAVRAAERGVGRVRGRDDQRVGVGERGENSRK